MEDHYPQKAVRPLNLSQSQLVEETEENKDLKKKIRDLQLQLSVLRTEALSFFEAIERYAEEYDSEFEFNGKIFSQLFEVLPFPKEATGKEIFTQLLKMLKGVVSEDIKKYTTIEEGFQDTFFCLYKRLGCRKTEYFLCQTLSLLKCALQLRLRRNQLPSQANPEEQQKAFLQDLKAYVRALNPDLKKKEKKLVNTSLDVLLEKLELGYLDSNLKEFALVKEIIHVCETFKTTSALREEEREKFVKFGLRARKGEEPGFEEDGESYFSCGLTSFCPKGNE